METLRQDRMGICDHDPGKQDKQGGLSHMNMCSAKKEASDDQLHPSLTMG